MTAGQSIVDEVRVDLNDTDTPARFTDAQMLRWCNAAERRIITLRPEANIIETALAVAANAGPRYVLPSGGIKFISVQNDDVDNSVRGPRIRRVEMDAMDSSFPEWGYDQTARPNTPGLEQVHAGDFFDNYMHDSRTPKVFYLFPVLSASASVNVTYSHIPTPLASLASVFTIGDEYYEAIATYIHYRALALDGRYGAGTAARQELYSAFLRELGIFEKQEERVSPENNAAPGGD